VAGHGQGRLARSFAVAGICAVLTAGSLPAIAAPVVPAGDVSVSASRTTGSIVVGIDASRDASAAADAIEAAGGHVTESRPGARFLVAEIPADADAARFSETLAADRAVRYVEPQTVIRAFAGTNDPGYPSQWNLPMIGAPAAWAASSGDASVTVAVIDTGVDLDNRDLVGRLDTEHDKDFVGHDTVAQDEDGKTPGHGTAVASIIAAKANNAIGIAGIAPGVRILPIRVLDKKATGTDTDLALGIRWAADHGAGVINISIGGTVGTSVLSDAVDYATSKDCVVVAASGNFLNAGMPEGELAYPAAFPDVIAVGAVDHDKWIYQYSQVGRELDLVAPGVEVWTVGRDNRLQKMTGTSMASPHVAAVAALVRSRFPSWSAAQVGDRLCSTAEDDAWVSGFDETFGWGIIRADRAVGVGYSVFPPSDDDLPGVSIGASPQRGAVSATGDRVDLYRIRLGVDQGLQAALKAASGSRVLLSLLPEGSLTTTVRPLESAESTGSSAPIALGAPGVQGAGTYYLMVTALEGSGDYSLSWRRGRLTDVSIAAPATVQWGASASIKGTLSAQRLNSKESLAAFKVVLDRRAEGASSWTRDVARTTTNAKGAYSFKVKPGARYEYRVRFAGVPGELSSVSDTKVIRPLARITIPTVPATAASGDTITTTGVLKPAGSALTVIAYRHDGSEWKAQRTVVASTTPIAGGVSYRARIALGEPGRWKLVARAAETARHAATLSGGREFTLE
jgi:hypothetical protein